MLDDMNELRADNRSKKSPQLADIGPDVPWAWDTTAFWWGQATGKVDVERTAQLSDPRWDVPVHVNAGNMWENTVYGSPYQVADEGSKPLKVWDQKRTMELSDLLRILRGKNPKKLIEEMPFPGGFVRILGDPNPTYGDLNSILWAPKRHKLYETIEMRPTFVFGASYVCKMVVWDTSKSWSKTKGGTCAANIPNLPTLPRREEFDTGVIRHMCGLVMDRYNKAMAPGTPARGSDGLSAIHPVRSGDKLRLTSAAYFRLMNEHKDNPLAVTLLTTFRDYGLIVKDKNTMNGDDDNSGRATVPMPQDVWFKDKGFKFRLSDLEIVSWGG